MMSDLGLWIVILGGMAVTVVMRLSFILLIPQEQLPTTLRRSLRYVPPAVLSAILFPDILMPAEVLDLSLDNHRFLAGLAAALVAWRTRNTWLTILTGMGVLVLLSRALSTG